MYTRAFVLRAKHDEFRWIFILGQLVKAMGMEVVGPPAIWSYPVNGKGGSGQTIVQPITESFLALDTWPDHDGAYLFICSCKPFDAAAVRTALADNLVDIQSEKHDVLGIAP